MSKPRPRPLLIGILVAAMMLVPALGSGVLLTYAQNDTFSSFDLANDAQRTLSIVVSRFEPVTSPEIEFKITNLSHITTTFELDVPDLPSGWGVTIDPLPTLSVPPNPNKGPGSFENTVFVKVQFTIPAKAAPGSQSVTVTARRLADIKGKLPTAHFSQSITFNLQASSTPDIKGKGCPDRPAPGSDFKHALLIRPDIAEIHGLCKNGEEDWFKFGAAAGKFYTIEVTHAEAGLDPVIDLFDDQQHQLTSNDDIPAQYRPTPTLTPTALPSTPPPATPAQITAPGPDILAPLIKSFHAPRGGMYYLRVRDAAGIGGNNGTYQIIVHSESYGSEPVLVPEVCNDRYEPDGLPENAQLIKSNDTQLEHRLCPSGDADWVKFYAHPGLLYSLGTTTAATSGADTIVSLFYIDGTTWLTDSDNLEASLNSQIVLESQVSGFFYAQIKNVGDIGDQRITYTLKLDVCITKTSCTENSKATKLIVCAREQASCKGLVDTTLAPVVICTSEQIRSQDCSKLANTQQRVLAPANPNLSAVQPAAALSSAAGPGFTPDASGDTFLRLWQRNDRPIAERRVARSWLWGPEPLRQTSERYDQGPGGVRQVAYFDKGRMEINNPAGDRNSLWYITSGRLVVELISGRMQTGDASAVQGSPANIPIAGDLGDPSAPTYASFGGVTSFPVGDRGGQFPDQQIYRDGRISLYAGSQRPETQLAHFIGETGHNIPHVFWDYLTSNGTIYADGSYRSGLLFDWVFVLGYPLSEPYWASVRVGGAAHDVLIQPFERRVLTYMPDDKPGWQVQMGNVGRHYYQWRYNQDPSS